MQNFGDVMSKDLSHKVACPICYEQYDAMVHVPYSAMFRGCGHTVCAVCLPNLVKSNPICPVCRTVCSPNEGEWVLNMNLYDAIPSLEGNLEVNEELRKLNEKYEKENKELLKEYEELTGRSKQKVPFTGRSSNQTQRMSIRFESRRRLMDNWIINWQYQEMIGVVNNLLHDNHVLDNLNAHLRNENSKLETELRMIKLNNKGNGN